VIQEHPLAVQQLFWIQELTTLSVHTQSSFLGTSRYFVLINVIVEFLGLKVQEKSRESEKAQTIPDSHNPIIL
jgi:hypothetical protein